jgi:hypothetical protein
MECGDQVPIILYVDSIHLRELKKTKIKRRFRNTAQILLRRSKERLGKSEAKR